MAQAGMRTKGVDAERFRLAVVPNDMANDNGQRDALVARLLAAGFVPRARAVCAQIAGDVFVVRRDGVADCER